uniref:Uncharacterized protein n=1 Tax=Amphora coffeiformis TaxID=265554 RepID=A0A7S3LAV5_9STRA|mmetsp:Transcript_16966/g.31718  ORF Transcript_16966/g.31718 Transcript_16966/m.31718 type:complete len:431 (-) Transcript_16966:234-1526(-)|eukprot:scaffold162_cov176-Amphora_coffeaeformis.AAC.9
MRSTEVVVGVALVVLAIGIALVVTRKHKQRNEQHTSIPVASSSLVTDNVLWIHDEGHVCLQGDAVQFWSHSEGDAVIVQEVIGNEMYTYERINTDALYAEARALLDKSSVEGADTLWIDALVGVKYNCVMETLDEEMDVTSPILLERHQDESSTWQVGPWQVQADSNMVPRSLSTHPDEDDEDDFEISIAEVGTCRVPIVGCDPLTEAGDIHIPYDGPTDAQWQSLFDAAGVVAPDVTVGDGHERFLGVWQDLTNSATQTKWCGYGTPKSNPCPGDPAVVAEFRNYDYEADRACRRHDHGRKFTILPAGFVRTECMHDRDLLLVAGDNLALTAVYGKYGLAATFGCYGYGNYKCWKKWRYRCQCRGERVRFGAGRYDNNERNEKWGYYSPADPSVPGGVLCPDDLWRCDGNQYSDLCREVFEPKQAEGSC